MQLYGLDGKLLVPAAQAEPGKNYRCPECGGEIRLKSRGNIQPHFFHLYKTKDCLRAQRSSEHLELQLYIQKLLPGSQLECHFPEIGRIADVAWPTGKTIFEIQYSSISEKEAKKRCSDYERLGFRIVWVLHEKQFNKKILSRAEAFLRKKTCYYSNMNQAGKGIIYDQFELVNHRLRRFKSKPLRVNLSHPSLMSLSLKDAPHSIKARAKSWPLYHEGDLVDHFLDGGLAWTSVEKSPQKGPRLTLKQRYRALLYILLEILER
jgi:competence protein CoiA